MARFLPFFLDFRNISPAINRNSGIVYSAFPTKKSEAFIKKRPAEPALSKKGKDKIVISATKNIKIAFIHLFVQDVKSGLFIFSSFLFFPLFLSFAIINYFVIVK